MSVITQLFTYIKYLFFIEVTLYVSRALCLIYHLIAAELLNFITYVLFFARLVIYFKSYQLFKSANENKTPHYIRVR